MRQFLFLCLCVCILRVLSLADVGKKVLYKCVVVVVVVVVIILQKT